MSDTAFVPGQLQAADTEPAVDEAEGKSRRALVMVGVVALALVFGMVAWLLFFSGSDATTPKADQAPAPAPAAVQPSAAPSVAAPKTATVPRSKHDFRDPFKVLIQPAAADTGGTSSGTTSAGSTGTSAGTTAGSTSGTTSGSSTTTGGTTTPSASVAHRLKVVSVSADNKSITIRVDGKTYKNLKAGEVFAEFFKVIGIGGAVNAIQFGDEKFNISGNKAVTLAS